MRSSALLLSAVLSACSHLPPVLMRDSTREHLEFLTQATNATPAAREQMWRENAASPADTAQLRKALLQSIPGSARYNPAAAEKELRALLEQRPSAGAAAVARTRLDALRAMNDCRAENEELKERLSKIADIERNADAPSRRP